MNLIQKKSWREEETDFTHGFPYHGRDGPERQDSRWPWRLVEKKTIFSSLEFKTDRGPAESPSVCAASGKERTVRAASQQRWGECMLRMLRRRAIWIEKTDQRRNAGSGKPENGEGGEWISRTIFCDQFSCKDETAKKYGFDRVKRIPAAEICSLRFARS